MKTKYMSRKFIVALCGLIITLVALILNNNVIAIGGLSLAMSFILGESFVDAFASTKKNINIVDNTGVKENA